MLNREAATTARNRLAKAVDEQKSHLENATQLSTKLFELRRSSSHELVAEVEAFVNTLANTPKEFSRTFAEYRVELKAFDGIVKQIDSQFFDTTVKSTAGAGDGVAAGAATAFAGPTAAMAIATTFGTASTGTAISALSGASATNAALAWLGGGALAAGGGMSAGGALLAVAGPVGLGLAGIAIVGGVGYAAHANSKTAEEASPAMSSSLRTVSRSLARTAWKSIFSSRARPSWTPTCSVRPGATERLL
ncbi:hypothetical protein PQR57_13545 [Paraburkholderia dipogonis]|uniref:Uncharacterized protein n=1 Tax=Paraburkholderia dipogonis TaxID=1211383 RepID=A0ABW9AN85_9BURK